MYNKNYKNILKNLILLVACVLINFLGRMAADSLELPVWLDCVGTYLAAFFAGPVVTIATAVISQILTCLIINVGSLLYVIPAVIIAIALIFCKRKKFMKSLYKMVIASFVTGVICVVISTPLNMIFHSGYSGNMWGDALVDMLVWYDFPMIFAATAGEIIVEIIDKQICFIIGFAFVRLCLHIRKGKHIKKSNKASKNVISGIIAMSLLVASVMSYDISFADENDTNTEGTKNYITTVYDNTSGMMSSEANTIAETSDGCIWIGSYAGLTKYDGHSFEFVQESGIVNVTALFCDSSGRLWVGTNDGGVARYEDGEFTFFTTALGLADNGIRAFAEETDGSVYVGTMGCISHFDLDDNITTVHENISYTRSMTVANDKLIVVDNNGSLYVIDDDKILAEYDSKSTGIFFECASGTDGEILAGASDGRIYRINIDDDNDVSLLETDSQVNTGINQIAQTDDGAKWLCTENGYGYIDSDGNFQDISGDYSGISFESVMEDYQGNIWLTSTRLGVIKLAESKFTNLFEKYELDSAVVNAVTYYDGMYYVGTDTGLIILDKISNVQADTVQNELTDMLSESRIRSLMVDGNNQLWICVYGDDGLICYNEDGEINSFNMENSGTTSDRMRCTLETTDGTIIAGTSDGINFIKNKKVVATIEEDLPNSQILCLLEADDGTVYAGSDGGGIYVINDMNVTDIITVDDGLSSDVILRMTAYDDGYFIVTSNSLCYMKDGEISRLSNFPYYNNYDIVIIGEKAYVLSSAGIYIADADDMASDKDISYQLLDSSAGLLSGLTSNSWCYTDSDGKIYLCTNSGVVLYDEALNSDNIEYKFGITSIDCDGESISYDLTGTKDIILSSDAKNVTIRATIYNYALSDVKVKFFVEGVDNASGPISYQDIEPIQLSNITHGSYKICLQIYDSSGTEILQEMTYVIEKETQIWEKTWYRLYLAFVCTELMAFIIWMIISIYLINKKKTELEEIRKELEEKVEEQIKEIKEKDAHEMNMIRKIIVALSDTVDAKDRYTSGHSKRVAEYARMIAKRMGKSEEEQQEIYYTGLLHDVGKIRVPEEIINKPGKLTDEEYDLIKVHPVTSYHILKDISEDSMIAKGARYHHERYDGRGYPNGISGTDIPEIARIIAVADAYDAMASNRSYRPAMEQNVVRDQIVKGRGTQFDPDLADIMLSLIDEDTEYTMKERTDDTKNILVIEDDTENADRIKAILLSEGIYMVSCSPDCETAVKLLEKEEFNLVLLDIDVPETDVFKFFAGVKDIHGIPIVFMSENREYKNIYESAEMGASDYLTKPFSDISLKEVVHNIMWL